MINTKGKTSRILLGALLGALVLVPAPVQAQQDVADELMQLDLAGPVRLSDLVDLISEELGLNIVYDQALRDRNLREAEERSVFASVGLSF